MAAQPPGRGKDSSAHVQRLPSGPVGVPRRRVRGGQQSGQGTGQPDGSFLGRGLAQPPCGHPANRPSQRGAVGKADEARGRPPWVTGPIRGCHTGRGRPAPSGSGRVWPQRDRTSSGETGPRESLLGWGLGSTVVAEAVGVALWDGLEPAAAASPSLPRGRLSAHSLESPGKAEPREGQVQPLVNPWGTQPAPFHGKTCRSPSPGWAPHSRGL